MNNKRKMKKKNKKNKKRKYFLFLKIRAGISMFSLNAVTVILIQDKHT
jgi:hypothetical protein